MKCKLRFLIWPALLVLLFVLAAGGCSLFSVDDAALPDDNDSDDDAPLEEEWELAYISGGDLKLLSPGGEPDVLTGWGDVVHLAWSPDGRKIAYYRQAVPGLDAAELRVKNLDDNNDTLVEPETLFLQFATQGISPWSPDSGELAYWLKDQHTLRFKTLGGSVAEYITDGFLSGGPWWQPGGQILAYTASADHPYGDLKVHLRSKSGDFSWSLPFATNPRWLPDGSGLVLARYEEEIYRVCTELAVVNQQGLDYRVLPGEPGGGWAPLFQVSPQGGQLALGNYDALVLVDCLGEEAPVVLAGQQVMTTYSEFSYPVRFTWSPQGNLLAACLYTQTAELGHAVEGYWDLVIVDLNTMNLRTLWSEVYTIDEAHPDAPPMDSWREPLCWFPDGSALLVLQGNAEGGFDIWRVDAAGAGPPELFLENADCPVFRPGS